MRREVVFDADLADGRAHGGKPDAGCVQLSVDDGKLTVCAVHKAFSVYAPHFNVADAHFLQRFQLAIQRRVDLIGETADQKIFSVHTDTLPQ